MRRVFGGFGLIPGALYPLRALVLLLRRPQLWPYLLVPILINLIVGAGLYGGLLFWGWHGLTANLMAIETRFSDLNTSLPINEVILQILASGFVLIGQFLVVLGLLLIIGFILMQFGVLLGAPWYGKLSEQLELIQTGHLESIEVSLWRDIGRAILFEIKKLILLLGLGTPLLLLNWLPGLGTLIATIGSLTLVATLTALDFLDAPLERRRLRFRHKLHLAWRSFPASASFSLTCMALISLPFLNLLTIPLCVASGTLFVCDRILPRLEAISSAPVVAPTKKSVTKP